ncbi:hypothetical protein KAR48_02395 [bacterium]|nr:hypothetical protein [bacterium]
MQKYLKQILHIPQFPTEEENKIARILIKILCILPIYYSIIIFIQLLIHDNHEVRLLISGYLLLNSAFILLKKQKLRLAIFVTALVVLAQVTAIATYSYGIRDLALFAYPGILILMSLLLDKRHFIILTLITVLSIAWIALGASYGWYTVKPPPTSSFSDFIIVSTLIILTAFMAHLLADNTRLSLEKAREEIKQREQMSLVIECNLREKEMLLKEIHHRVKNNLTVINSLLNLQKKRITNTEQAITAFEDMRSRIISMALVHEQLYKSNNFSEINMRNYIQNLTRQLQAMYSSGYVITIKTDIEGILLSIDNAIPCGIIINETITNAFKHAFKNTDNPCIIIELKHAPHQHYQLIISDNGIGLPVKFDMDNPDSMGLRLIHLLIEQLDASMTVIRENGTCFKIIFPETPKIKSLQKKIAKTNL